MELETLLMDMRKEQRDDHGALTAKVDAGFKEVADTLKHHEQSDLRLFAAIDKRVSTVEGTRKALIWLVGVIIVAVLGGAVDAYFNHHFVAKEEPRATELSHPAEAGVSGR